MYKLKNLLTVSLLLGGLIVTAVLDADQGVLEVKDGWIRQMPPGARTLAAYMTLTNSGKNEIIIKSMSSNLSELTELHTVSMDNDLMKMRKLPELVIQPGESIELKQGSMHVMLINVTQSVVAGDEVQINFELEGRPAVSVSVPVRKE